MLRRKVKLLQDKLRRRNKKINDLESMLFMARKCCGMSSDTSQMLKDTYGEIPFELLIHQLKNKSRKPCGQRYTSAIKEFATTLYFYSPRSYSFLRSKISLPHPSMIRSWVSSTDCYPGFMDEAIAYLKRITTENGHNLDCALIIDAMSIRKQVIWDKGRNKYAGYVECAGLVDGKEQCLASEALVFLVVSMTRKFKVPVAYFFIDKVSGEILSQLIRVCLTKLHSVNVNIRSITADGVSCNVRAFELLGCKIQRCNSFNEFKTHFLHPNSLLPVYIVFDPCHMLKLARNILAEKLSLTSNMGNISWQYLKALKNVQDELEFKFANKLSGAHINYKNKVMNVALAAQTLSSGTADALEFLMHIKNPIFDGAEATVQFIRMIDRIFDLLNSRTPFGKGFKSPLYIKNQSWWNKIFLETADYLLSLKLNDLPVVKTQKKMFAVGLIVTIKSISLLSQELLTQTAPLQYFLTYKVSQDHIELFFNSIRASGGYNNNPNVCQFRWSMRKLLLAGNISARNSNCLSNSVVVPSILEFRSPKRALVEPCFSDEEKVILSVYSECLDEIILSEYLNNILYYIGGYIIKSILKQLTCPSCITMLQAKEALNSSFCRDPKSFTTFVSKGGLKMCSLTVFKIVSASEKAFKHVIIKNSSQTSNDIAFKCKYIINKHLSAKKISFFHPIENEIGFEDLHESQVTKIIIERYLNIRLKHHAKNLTLKEIHNNRTTKRQKLSKIILFQNV